MSGSIDRAKRGLVSEWRLHALSVVSLAVAFVCLGAALLVVVNLHGLKERWGRTGRASVYLKDSASPREVEQLAAALKQAPSVREVRYVAPADAKSTMTTASDPLMARVSQDAFPASLEIDVADGTSEADVAALVGKLQTIGSVESVETYASWTARLGKLLSAGTLAASALATIVFGAVLAVVASTMRLALTRRRTEVEVLKLVGATDGFVRRPYVIEGAALGATGAVFALALLGALFHVVRARFDGDLGSLIGLDPTFLPPPAMLALVMTGAMLGAMGGALGLRKLTAV
jgi:cell division transport system permease protein